MATWARTLSVVTCYRGTCGVNIPRGELVCLVSTAKLPACRRCASKLFGYEPPTDVPALPAPRPPVVATRQLPLSDSAEPPATTSAWTHYKRQNVANKALSSRQLNAANATDPKLRQLGGDR